MANITDTWLRANHNKKTDKEIIKSDGDGLSARLRNGRITFIFRTTLKSGERIKLTLGSYPEMSLKSARDDAKENRAIVAKGRDPRKTKKDTIEKNVKEKTVDDIFNYWFKYYVCTQRSDAKTVQANYTRHIGNEFGNIYYSDIDQHDWFLHFLGKVKKAPSMILRVASEFKQAVNYCINHHYLDHPNNLLTISAKSLMVKRNKTDRTLADNEIKALFDFMAANEVAERDQLIIELILLTGCRSGELRNTQLSWLDFDEGIWRIPKEYHKTGKVTNAPLLRPIIQEWRPLFERLAEISGNNKFLITNFESKLRRSTGSQLTVGAMLNIPFTIIKRSQRLALQQNTKPGFDPFSNHDLRRTARTNWSKFGSWEVCEKMLGHILPGESSVYDHHDYIEKMVPVYKHWYNRVMEIRGRRQQQKVVLFR